MTTLDFAYYITQRPVETVIEQIVSSIANLAGLKNADLYIEVLPKREANTEKFFCHEKTSHITPKNDTLQHFLEIFSDEEIIVPNTSTRQIKWKTDEIRLGRLYLLFTREA